MNVPSEVWPVGFTQHMHPQVLLIFPSRSGDSAEMLKGIMHHQRTHRPWVVSLHSDHQVESDADWVKSQKWHGVISCHTTPALVETCSQLLVPLVDLGDGLVDRNVAKIRPDNVAIGHVGAEFFMERKFRNFAFYGYSNLTWATERRAGFVEALELAGHRCDVLEADHPGEITPVWESKQTGLLATWLRTLREGSAVMTGDDLCAQQVIRAAHAAGLTVPEKIAVLGANNDAMQCDLTEPSLSSVAINRFEAGRRAAEILDQIMISGRPLAVDLKIEPQGVVARKSTDILAMRDKNVAIALNYIREHACKGITVDQVLARAFMSRSQLEHKFRRFVGRSPQVEIRRAQVAKISELLSDTDLPLKEIAEQTGFVHVEYLCVVFKRITGETPGQFRARTSQRCEQPWAVA